MERLARAYVLGATHDFRAVDLVYATTLALKILDTKCQMNVTDQELFMAVYDGIGSRHDTPWYEAIHRLIEDARIDGAIVAAVPYREAIRRARESAEARMDRSTMKAYKAMVRRALGEIRSDD